MKKKVLTPKSSQFIIYKIEDGKTRIDVRFDDERLKNPDLPFDCSEELTKRIKNSGSDLDGLDKLFDAKRNRREKE